MRTLLAALLLAASVFAQKKDPVKKDPVKPPDAATIQKIKDETAKLKTAVEEASKKVPDHEADLAIYVKAAEWIVKHNDWFTNDAAKQTFAVIAEGMKRAEAAKEGKTPWLEVEGRYVARGYRSGIDGSVQPYGVILPAGYGKDPKKRWRLDIHLHGRDGSLTEVKHLYQHAASKAAPKDLDYVQINIYGRGNNAYRWAGEEDVFEALDDFMGVERGRHGRPIIDERRLVLKGFSMGGAGTWHIGLRRSPRFAAIQPGAGFTTTHGYIAKLPDPLPDYQEKCLRIYDAYRYAENAFNVPIVAYSGEIDKQRQAATNIENELKRLKLSDRMTHLIGPGLEHKFPPEWVKKAETEMQKHLATDRPLYPKAVRVVAYTPKAAGNHWAQIDALERMYELARLDATWDGATYVVKTENVRRFRLDLPPRTKAPTTVAVDGAEVQTRPNDKYKPPHILFAKRDGKWVSTQEFPHQDGLTKSGTACGPIDDAFTASFLCVIGTGKPFHEATGRAAVAQLDRFRREWDKWMRGELLVKKDTEVTDADIQQNHLILFGDPSSNSQIAKALPKLPIQWTRDRLTFGGTDYTSADHLPMLVYPGVHHSGLYVVLNSGHTFHEADFQGTNALLYPRLGDYAVVKPTPTAKDPAAFEVVTAGLFDEKWQFPKK
jgi:hypothetical protein